MTQRFVVGLATTITAAGLLAPSARAGTGDEWSNFDSELEALLDSAPLTFAEAPTLEGFMKATWANLPNIPQGGTPVTYEDQSRFAVDRAQISLAGPLGGGAGFVLQLEGAGTNVAVLDAYGTWDVNEHFRVTMGHFRSPAVWQAQLHDGDLLFILRTATGELFYTRDNGVMLGGQVGMLHWSAAAQNGLDSVQDEFSFSLRAGLDLLGGGVGFREGAFGATDDAKLSFGLGWYGDQSQGPGKEGDVATVDAQFQMGRFAADGMWAKYQDFVHPLFGPLTDAMPWNVSTSFMILEEKLEGAVRYQDTDNISQERDITLGGNYYLGGHAIKVQVNASFIYSDDDHVDGTTRLGAAFNLRV